jgi:hypothetical protein
MALNAQRQHREKGAIFGRPRENRHLADRTIDDVKKRDRL